MSQRPAATEYAPYFEKYISLVPDGDIATLLEQQFARTRPFYESLNEQQAAIRYAPGKWSLKQMFAHVIDTERVFAYRALAFSRGDTQPLPSFDQDDWMKTVDFDAKPWGGLVEEFGIVRAASVALFRGMTGEMLQRMGTASNNPLSARAAGYIIVGHEEYHVRAMRQQYLSQASGQA